MKKVMIGMMAVAMVAPAFAFESVDELIKDGSKRDADALKAYIADHPKAEDLKEAQSMLVQNLIQADQSEEAAKILDAKFEKLMATKDSADLRELIGQTMMPLFNITLEAGKKDKAKSLIDRVEKAFADNENIEQIKKAMSQLTAQLGRPVVGESMDIKFKAVDGKDVDLSSMTGKVVLVDFWATWCGPCVAELPNVKKAYAKLHGKGFEIVGISLDQEKEQLEKFLKKQEGMTWPQCFSGEGWGDPTAKKFGITGIPAMFLIGKDGKIAAVNSRGPGVLEKAVAKALAN